MSATITDNEFNDIVALIKKEESMTNKNVASINENDFKDIGTLTPDEDSEVPRRKPIGWNYQNVFPSKPSKAKKQVNGACDTETSKSVSEARSKSSSDDIEVLEVKKVKKKVHLQPIFPASSTRKEIKDTTRGTVQASITRYLTKKTESSTPSTSSEGAKVNQKGTEEKSPNSDSEKNGLVENKENINQEPEISSDYSNSIVQKFIEKWKSVKTFGKDDEKVKERLLKHYKTCHTSYTQSRKFINGLKKGTKYLTEANLVKFISSIIESLKRYKDDPYLEKKKKLKNKEDGKEHSENEEEAKENEEKEQEEEEEEITDEVELKKKRKLDKIEAAMLKVSKKIQKLEVTEVDLDDNDNSAYLILDRLKQQFIKLDALYCKIAECSTATGRPLEKKFKFEGSRYPEINKRITAWVNKNRCFPDYMDILNLVKKVRRKNMLPMKPEVLRVEAQSIFRDVGKILKERREKDDMYCIFAYADDTLEMDPADMDADLGQKLDVNEKDAKKKLDEVFQLFVDKEGWKEEKEEPELGGGEEEDEEEKKEKKAKPKKETVKIKVEKEAKEDENSVEEMESVNEGGSETEIEIDDDDDEEDDEEEDEGSSDDVRECVEDVPPPSTTKFRPIEASSNVDINLDDSDDDIQEIKEILTSDLHYNDYDDEDDDIDTQFEDDVEVADSPAEVTEIVDRPRPIYAEVTEVSEVVSSPAEITEIVDRPRPIYAEVSEVVPSPAEITEIVDRPRPIYAEVTEVSEVVPSPAEITEIVDRPRPIYAEVSEVVPSPAEVTEIVDRPRQIYAEVTEVSEVVPSPAVLYDDVPEITELADSLSPLYEEVPDRHAPHLYADEEEIIEDTPILDTYISEPPAFKRKSPQDFHFSRPKRRKDDPEIVEIDTDIVELD